MRIPMFLISAAVKTVTDEGADSNVSSARVATDTVVCRSSSSDLPATLSASRSAAWPGWSGSRQASTDLRKVARLLEGRAGANKFFEKESLTM